MHRITLAVLGLATALPLATPALAGGHCETCFRREVTPPRLGVVHETVQVRPAMVVAQPVPAEIGVVRETVQVRPAHVVAHPVPARFATVHQTVQVAPATRVLTRSYDAHGREVICQTTQPARYGTVARTVMTRAPGVVHQVVPAQYATVERHVVTRPAGVVHHVVPARYGTVARTVVVAPGSERWVRVGRHHHQHHRSGHVVRARH